MSQKSLDLGCRLSLQSTSMRRPDLPMVASRPDVALAEAIRITSVAGPLTTRVQRSYKVLPLPRYRVSGCWQVLYRHFWIILDLVRQLYLACSRIRHFSVSKLHGLQATYLHSITAILTGLCRLPSDFGIRYAITLCGLACPWINRMGVPHFSVFAYLYLNVVNLLRILHVDSQSLLLSFRGSRARSQHVVPACSLC